MTATPKAIFFDMDGTILDWTTGMEESWLASCELHGPGGELTPAELHAAIRERRTWFWGDQKRAYRGRMDLDGASREIVRRALFAIAQRIIARRKVQPLQTEDDAHPEAGRRHCKIVEESRSSRPSAPLRRVR